MFASFFHSPLFSEAGTARELNAVDSEHKKNSQSDRWRIFQLGKGLSGDIRGAGESGSCAWCAAQTTIYPQMASCASTRGSSLAQGTVAL